MDSARHVITRILNLHSINWMASSDVASIILKSLPARPGDARHRYLAVRLVVSVRQNLGDGK
jgi:hypothetical protein